MSEETIEGLRSLEEVVAAADLNRLDIQVACLSSRTRDNVPEWMSVTQSHDRKAPLLSMKTAGGPKGNIRSISELILTVRRGDWDIVHADSVRTSVLGRLAGKLSVGGNNTIYVRGRLFGKRDRRHRYWERLASKFTDAILSLSKAEQESLIRQEIATEKKAPHVSAGIDISRYRGYVPDGNLRGQLGVAVGTLLVGSASLSSHPEEPESFVAIYKRVSRDHPPAHFIWIGNACTCGNVELLAKATGMEDRIHTLAYAADLRSTLSQLDVFVTTTTASAFGYVTCEAMALGVPVVAARASGSEEVVAPGITGYLVPAGEAEIFGLAVHLLLDDAALRARLGRAGRKRAMELFDLSTMTKRLEELYVSLLKERL